MSTNFYRLHDPLSKIALDEGDQHDTVRVWEAGAYCGSLKFTAGVGREAVKWFASGACVLRTYWGGEARGLVVMECEANLAEDLQVVSESGQLTTVKDVRARAGEAQGRSSGT